MSTSELAELITTLRNNGSRSHGTKRSAEETLQLWQAFLAGDYRLVESFDRGGRHSMLAVRAPSTRRALTPREVAVIEQVARGYSNKRVGAILGIATGTVAAHLAAAAKKLGCRRRTELLALAASVRT